MFGFIQGLLDGGKETETVIIKTMKTLIIAAAIALLASSSQADPRTVTGPARVIDGDTVVVAGTHVRLKGVDAAELGTGRGENAKQFMSSIVPPAN